MRGGERVLEALCRLFPEADIFTHVMDPAVLSPTLSRHRIRTTFIARLPLARRWYQKYLPLMPLALESLDLSGYDLVISSESGPAKGVITGPDCIHICYCHSPMRYAWDMYHAYTQQLNPVLRLLIAPMMLRLRAWDLQSSFRVDHFIANSSYVAKRIRKIYRRDAQVINPPVAVEDFQPSVDGHIGDYYLYLGQLVRYKRPDIAVDAFSSNGRRLIVAGAGELFEPLRSRAAPNVEMLGRRPFQEILQLYQGCRALVFPGVEDFGLVPIEAMACGRPVIAYAAGGALETVVDGKTGVLFRPQAPDGLTKAVEQFEADEQRYDSERIRGHSLRFSENRFRSEMIAFLTRCGLRVLPG
jgi:glycosyltransferase involved in cell wall biosynthesis